MTHTTPTSNKQLPNVNSLCNSQSQSREIISELHAQCQQIPRSRGTKCITSLTEVYAMLTSKHKDEKHWTNRRFAVLNLLQL